MNIEQQLKHRIVYEFETNLNEFDNSLEYILLLY